MDVNTEELHLIYKQIKADPDTWWQQAWAKNFDKSRSVGHFVPEGRCGTAYCFAGHVVVRAGYAIAWNAYGSSDLAVGEDGTTYAINALAEDILGLEPDWADELFCASNDLEDIRRIITELTGEDPED